MSRILMNTIAIAIVLTITSCDPAQIVYIKNNTDSQIEVYVQHSDIYKNDTSNIELKYTDKLIQGPKVTSRFDFEKKLYANRINNTNYRISFPAKTTSLIEPMTIGIPIKRIIIQSYGKIDTISFDRMNPNWKELRDKGILTKRGFSTFTIEYSN